MVKAIVALSALVFLSWGFAISYYYQLENEKLKHSITKANLEAAKQLIENSKEQCKRQVSSALEDSRISKESGKRSTEVHDFFHGMKKGHLDVGKVKY